MKQNFIKIEDLKISPLNVRKHGDKTGEDLIPSIRAMGIIQPLLVRANCDGYEVIAGQRRFNAAVTLAKEQDIDPVPCLIMEDGDDVAAIEASLAENIERLPMDELDQFEAFRALSRAGRSIGEIAFTFGVSERLVHQRLALSNLHPPILNAYRRQEISAADLRNLTMATRKQQKAWWKLFTSEDETAPTGFRLKSWLFGGDEVPVGNALFDLETYPGAITSDLFGDEQYFADSALFWEHQATAIAELASEYQENGWSSVIVHDVGERWYRWECVEVSREDGGEVHVTCASNGEVEVFEGFLDEKTYRKRQKQQSNGKEPDCIRPELTKPMQNYLALHRHSAVRTELLNHQGIALRVLLARVIAGTKADSRKADKEEITDSLSTNKAESPFAAEKEEIARLLGLEGNNHPTLLPRIEDWGRGFDVHEIFAALLKLDDETVSRILTFVTAETLAPDTALIEGLGVLLNVEMADHWRPDETFFDLFKDKEAINAALADCASKNVAKANITATAKVQKGIIKQCLSGERTDGNPDWQPAYMRFPMKGYTKRDGLRALDMWLAVKEHFSAA